MAIRVEHRLSAGSVGGPAFGAGQEDRRRYENANALKIAEMQQRERMQQMQLAAQQASQARSIAAQQQAQNFDRLARLQQMVLGNEFQQKNLGAQQKFQQDMVGINAKADLNMFQQQAKIENDLKVQEEKRKLDAAKNLQQEELQQQQGFGGDALSVSAPSPQHQQFIQQRQQLEEQFDYSPTQQATLADLQAQRDKLAGLVASGKVSAKDARDRFNQWEKQEQAIVPKIPRLSPQQQFETQDTAVDPKTGQPYVRGDWKPGAKQPQETPPRKSPELAATYQRALAAAPEGSSPEQAQKFARETTRQYELIRLGPGEWAENDYEGQLVTAEAVDEARKRGMSPQQAELHVRRKVLSEYNRRLNGSGAGAQDPFAQKAPGESVAPNATTQTSQQGSNVPLKNVPEEKLTPQQQRDAQLESVRQEIVRSGAQIVPATPEERRKVPGMVGKQGGVPLFVDPRQAHAYLPPGTPYMRYNPNNPAQSGANGQIHVTPVKNQGGAPVADNSVESYMRSNVKPVGASDDPFANPVTSSTRMRDYNEIGRQLSPREQQQREYAKEDWMEQNGYVFSRMTPQERSYALAQWEAEWLDRHKTSKTNYDSPEQFVSVDLQKDFDQQVQKGQQQGEAASMDARQAAFDAKMAADRQAREEAYRQQQAQQAVKPVAPLGNIYAGTGPKPQTAPQAPAAAFADQPFNPRRAGAGEFASLDRVMGSDPNMTHGADHGMRQKDSKQLAKQLGLKESEMVGTRWVYSGGYKESGGITGKAIGYPVVKDPATARQKLPPEQGFYDEEGNFYAGSGAGNSGVTRPSAARSIREFLLG